VVGLMVHMHQMVSAAPVVVMVHIKVLGRELAQLISAVVVVVVVLGKQVVLVVQVK